MRSLAPLAVGQEHLLQSTNSKKENDIVSSPGAVASPAAALLNYIPERYKIAPAAKVWLSQVMKGGWAFALVAASAAAIGMYVSARPAHAQRSLEEKMRRKASAASMQHQANQ